MARRLKVYGWTGHRAEAPGPHRQTREIVAAPSIAEVCRITGKRRTDLAWSICETGNDVELEVALANPGVVFWCGLNDARQASDFTEARRG